MHLACGGYEPPLDLVHREKFPLIQYPAWESNPQSPGFKPGRSAIGVAGWLSSDKIKMAAMQVTEARSTAGFEPATSRLWVWCSTGVS